MLFNQRVLKHARAIKEKQIANENKSSISQTRQEGVILHHGSEGKSIVIESLVGHPSATLLGANLNRTASQRHSVTASQRSLPAASG